MIFWHTAKMLNVREKRLERRKIRSWRCSLAACAGRWGGPQEGYKNSSGPRLWQELQARAKKPEELGSDLARRAPLQARGGGSLPAFHRTISIGLWVVGLFFCPWLSSCFFCLCWVGCSIDWVLGGWVVFLLLGCWIVGLLGFAIVKY